MYLRVYRLLAINQKSQIKQLHENLGISRLQLRITVLLLLLLAFGLIITNVPNSQNADSTLSDWSEETDLLKQKVAEIESLWYEQRTLERSRPTSFFNEKINLNTASSEEFARLPGIGPVLAQRIIDFRNQNGNFTSIDDLINVKGIGQRKLEKIRNSLILK